MDKAQSSAEAGVWIKRTKQGFEPNEKQQTVDSSAGRVYWSLVPGRTCGQACLFTGKNELSILCFNYF